MGLADDLAEIECEECRKLAIEDFAEFVTIPETWLGSIPKRPRRCGNISESFSIGPMIASNSLPVFSQPEPRPQSVPTSSRVSAYNKITSHAQPRHRPADQESQEQGPAIRSSYQSSAYWRCWLPMSVQESAEEPVPLAESNTGSNSNAPQPGSKSTAIKARLRLRPVIHRLDCVIP